MVATILWQAVTDNFGLAAKPKTVPDHLLIGNALVVDLPLFGSIRSAGTQEYQWPTLCSWQKTARLAKNRNGGMLRVMMMHTVIGTNSYTSVDWSVSIIGRTSHDPRRGLLSTGHREHADGRPGLTTAWSVGQSGAVGSSVMRASSSTRPIGPATRPVERAPSDLICDRHPSPSDQPLSARHISHQFSERNPLSGWILSRASIMRGLCIVRPTMALRYVCLFHFLECLGMLVVEGDRQVVSVGGDE